MCTPDVCRCPLSLVSRWAWTSESHGLGSSTSSPVFLLAPGGDLGLLALPPLKTVVSHMPLLSPYYILPNMKSSHSFGFHTKKLNHTTSFINYERGSPIKGSCYTAPGLQPSTEFLCLLSTLLSLSSCVSGTTPKVPELYCPLTCRPREG